MELSPADQEVVAEMKQRELHLKRRERASDVILYRVRRYRAVLVTLAAVVVVVVVTGMFLAVESTLPSWSGWWRPTLVVVVLGAVLGVHLGQALLRTDRGRRLLASKEAVLRGEYSSDLYAGRRWLQFYYQGEDISAYVPQILYFIEGERRFDSVGAALEFAKSHRREGDWFSARALDMFSGVATQSSRMVVSSADEAGRPTSRIMCFVKSDRAGVWFVSMPPHGPKAGEFDRGRIALLTLPTESGATISSNRVRIRRTGRSFVEVADLYRDQVPGYVDGMTVTEQQHELVYEVTLQSARVDTWLEHELVELKSEEADS